MLHTKKTRRLVAALAAIALVATGCGGDDDEPADDETGAESPTDDDSPTDDETDGDGDMAMDDIAMDVGVTAEPCPEPVNEGNGCIYLGIISDFSGPFQTFGEPITKGQQAFWQRVNENGGVGGMFDVAIPDDLVADGQYNAQVTTEEYQRLEPEIAALAQTLGTPQTQPIIPTMEEDGVIAATLTWWSGWEFEDAIVESGSNYCIDAMNGLEYLLLEEEQEISTVVHVGFPGDYGGDALAGLKTAAEANGVEVVAEVTQVPQVAGGNVTEAVNTIVNQNPDLVVLTVGPGETSEILRQTAEQQFAGQFLGNHPVFLPDLMALGPAIEGRLTTVGPHEAWDGESEGHAALRETYQAVHGGLPANDGATFGWVAEYPILTALEDALANGDLTRAGISEAAKSMSVDYQGMLPTAEFGGEPSDTVTRVSTLGRPDSAADLKLSTVVAGYTGPTAEGYDFSSPCVEVG